MYLSPNASLATVLLRNSLGCGEKKPFYQSEAWQRLLTPPTPSMGDRTAGVSWDAQTKSDDQTREVPTGERPGERREPEALESLSSLPIYVGQPPLAQ